MSVLLHQVGYVAGKTLFGFPWDWRASVRAPVTQQQLRHRLQEMVIDNDGLPVDVVSHSEGGLVVLSFIAENPGSCALT